MHLSYIGTILLKDVNDEHLTSRGLYSLRKVLRSPPAISSSRMNLGIACRLTPMQRTMFWWLNLLPGHKHSSDMWIRACFLTQADLSELPNTGL